MIDMFSNYQNIPENYTPNNLHKEFKKPCSYTKLDSDKTTLPYELYNAKGELEGYFWYQGNTINLEFNIDGEIVDETGKGTGSYIPANDYLAGKVATISIYDFRMNIIEYRTYPASPTINFIINKELSDKMNKGVYYCSLIISDDNTHETIFDTSDCKFLVK